MPLHQVTIVCVLFSGLILAASCEDEKSGCEKMCQKYDECEKSEPGSCMEACQKSSYFWQKDFYSAFIDCVLTVSCDQIEACGESVFYKCKLLPEYEEYRQKYCAKADECGVNPYIDHCSIPGEIGFSICTSKEASEALSACVDTLACSDLPTDYEEIEPCVMRFFSSE